MTKNINGDKYSDLITSADSRAMACGGIPRQKIDRIVIHHNATTNKNVAINTWLANAPAQTSANYEVADNEIIGIVGEDTTAWHAGNANMNARSIGIENVNSTGAPSWQISDKTFNSLAKLVADICKRYGFKPDTTHVIPHSQVTSTQCPGGINMDKLRQRAMEIYSGGKTSPKHMSDVDYMRQYGIVIWNGATFPIDDRATVYGLDQVISNKLSGGQASAYTTQEEWRLNGVPVSGVKITGNKFKFKHDTMTIVDYDDATNGIAVIVDGQKIWVSATTARRA